jgi:hypothetical protein|tara:strand:- start:935 stop:1456 length:522 start_codon:yes stop_codon:yes gene_type:complete
MNKKYRSGSEKKTGDLLESINVPFSFEPHYIEYTWLEYKKYLPDFLLPNGILLEVKGRFKLEDRKKHLFIRKHHPDIDIRFVFDNPNGKLNKGAKSSYADWCIKNGFLFCKNSDHQIIEEWANEKPKGKSSGRNISDKRRTSSRNSEQRKSRKSSVPKRSPTGTPRRNKARNK